MLSFSKTETLEFDYNNKSHLQTELKLTNNSTSPMYYKFKVNRPRYYLVKPDRGIMDPGASVTVTIKLHKEGISQANGDKFKCFYLPCSRDATEEGMDKFQDKKDTEKERFMVRINNLPRELDMHKELASSQLKSLANPGSNIYASNRMSSTSYQGTVREKQQRVKNLKAEIENIQRSAKHKKSGQGLVKNSKGSLVSYLVVSAVGLGLGVLSSFWF